MCYEHLARQAHVNTEVTQLTSILWVNKLYFSLESASSLGYFKAAQENSLMCIFDPEGNPGFGI